MQNYTINSYQSNHIGDVDLTNIENNFEVLRSMFSGTNSPPNSIIGMPWFDTTNKLLKTRNSLNNKWLGVMYGNNNSKMWFYSNSAEDGWIIDSTAPTDCVLALKGGAQAYNVSGGNEAGTWTQPNHILTEAQIPAHDHGEVGAHSHSFRYILGSGSFGYGYVDADVSIQSKIAVATAGAHTHTGGGGGGAHNHGDTYRLKAAVGTLQYLDI